MRRGLWVALVLAAGAVQAQDGDTAEFTVGTDLYRAARVQEVDAAGRDDLFLAGERVSVTGDVTGSGHVAGRWVMLEGGIGGDLYAMGQTVDLRGAVVGDATLAGQEVSVAGEVGGDLRLFGSEIALAAPVTGTAVIGGEFVDWDGMVGGDAVLTARDVSFGPSAGVQGNLILYEEEPGTLAVPETVAPEDRIERREADDWDDDFGDFGDYAPVSLGGMVGSFLMGVLFVTLASAVAAALMPETMARLRKTVLAQPGRAVLAGFLAQSVLVGGGILVSLTLIGLLLLPAAILVSVLAGIAGYLVGAYALGVGLLRRAGRHEPHDLADRALSAAVGALAVGLLGLIPVLGWILVLLLTLTGVGAIALQLFKPRFFVPS